MRLTIIFAVAVAAFGVAGCSFSGSASAVSVRSSDGQVTANSWSGDVGCEIGRGAGSPCSASSFEEHYP